MNILSIYTVIVKNIRHWDYTVRSNIIQMIFLIGFLSLDNNFSSFIIILLLNRKQNACSQSQKKVHDYETKEKTVYDYETKEKKVYDYETKKKNSIWLWDKGKPLGKISESLQWN